MDNKKEKNQSIILNSFRKELMAVHQKIADIEVNFKTAFSCKKEIDSLETKIRNLYKEKFFELDKKIREKSEQNFGIRNAVPYLRINNLLNLRNSLDNLFNILFSAIENAKMRANSYIALIVAFFAVIVSISGVTVAIISFFRLKG